MTTAILINCNAKMGPRNSFMKTNNNKICMMINGFESHV